MRNKIKLKKVNFNKRKIYSLPTHFLKPKLWKLGVLMLCVGTGLTGCYRSVSPNFYTLTPKITPLISSNIKLIEVIPVGLPERLNSQLLVLQDSNGKSYMLDSQRWTSTLSNELQSALSAGLQQKLGAIDIYNNGLSGGKVSYSIATEFSRFDIVEHANKAKTEIEVMASWVVKRNDPTFTSQNTVSSSQINCRLNFKNEVVGQSDNFVNIVKTYQDSLNRVTDSIAASTIALDMKKNPIIDGVICS